ncbi:MAG: formate acetyltransferase [Spirochaetes bacterium]|nr:formate acetyltransferase [Spirochaetota bacterium]
MLLYTHTQTARKKSSTNLLVDMLLRLMASRFNGKEGYRKYLMSVDGWQNFTVGIRTENGSVEKSISFRDGRVSVAAGIPPKADVVMIFATDTALRKLLTAPTTEQVYMLLKSEMRTEGKQTHLLLFLFLVSVLLHRMQIRGLKKEKARVKKTALVERPRSDPALSRELAARRAGRMKAPSKDPGVRFLDEPYLSRYSLDDFPRLGKFLDLHFTTRARVCIEMPALLTEWHRKNGFDAKPDGTPWVPELRRAHAFRHIMKNRTPIIHAGDLVAGTTTSKDVGALPYVDAAGTYLWSELFTVPHRLLFPYDIAPEDAWKLHHDIFPYWADKNFRERLRARHGDPLPLRIDERFAVYFSFKSSAFSHIIPNFPEILKKGTMGMIAELRQYMEGDDNPARNASRDAMVICLEGLADYSRNLASRAASDADKEADPARRAELQKLAGICSQVVERPARTLDEAVNAVWITMVGAHIENTNAGLSLGRLDQWLQPYFEADMEKLTAESDREEYLRHAIELIGCFFLRCTDHLPCMPYIATIYFGGSSSDQAITLGGVTPEGTDAVNDMTYIFLKVTELLTIRDPNMNARYHPGVNSDAYLKRLCEVNLITAATPSLHNDAVIMESLKEMNYEERDLNDWAAVGCVEPTIAGKQTGHTNFQLMNMVAALEMALNNGTHPLMRWKLGPDTGVVENGDFTSFEEFYEAFLTQFRFLIDESIKLNNWYAEEHQYVRPTPYISALIDGCARKGLDITRGGAKYNSSGTAIIGLADVTDSLMVIKKLVFEERKVSFADLKRAVDGDFRDDPALHAMVTRKVPFFGSGSDEAVALANRITKFIHDYYAIIPHYRGGRYTVGFWTMSQHVAFGTLTGALPSGRRAGMPFTPGLTPEPNASRSLLDNMRDVARLDPHSITNNMAFNVKVVPSSHDTREKAVDDMFSYVKTYFTLGGMQMQMNVVTSDTLRDAMAHPESYRNLLVRISGYNAYFVTLHRDLQLELIRRAEYGIER